MRNGILSMMAVDSIATALALYTYDQVYLGQADILRAAGERRMIAELLEFSRANGRFPDMANTPFPSDSELELGVQLTLKVVSIRQ